MATKKKASSKPAPKKKAAKKAVAKKSPAKKAKAKKAPAKKAAVKKAPAKKASTKKAPKKKSAVKKAAVKKSAVKKSPVKKSSAKKAAVKKSPAKKTAPAKPLLTASSLAVEFKPSTFENIAATKTVQTLERKVEPQPVKQPVKEEKKRRGGLIVALPVVVLVGFIAVANSGSDESAESPKTEVTAEPTPSETEVEVKLEAPVNVYADYTPTGGKITWSAPSAADQIQNYLVQAAYQGGEFSTIATLTASELSFEITKVDTPSFTTFRVVAVYPSGEATSDISELKGKYEVQP